MTVTTLYAFNPEHDYALADNHRHFVPPASARRFAHDCARLPACLAASPALLPPLGLENAQKTAKSTDEILIYLPYREKNCCINAFTGEPASDFDRIDKIVPWGWDKLIAGQLQEAGLPRHLLPAETQLDQWHELAHRRIAAQALRFLNRQHPERHWPAAPQMLDKIEDVRHFVESRPAVILKSPYSGNGRGHLYAYGTFTPTLERQCKGVLRRQGAIMCEKMYEVVQDFAIELHCADGKTAFCGYSLFKTIHYGYDCNILMPDDDILHFLSQFVGAGEIEEAKQAILTYCDTRIAPYYDGYLGVDMFVYQDNGHHLHPMVEINLRMTMGMASHIICSRYLHPEAAGTYRILYSPQPQALFRYAREMEKSRPLAARDGKWHDGIALLTPVAEATQYAVQVEIFPEKDIKMI